MAASTTPSSAPWRRFPVMRSRRNCCSALMARLIRVLSSLRRDAVEPVPWALARRSNAASTSSTVSVGVGAGSGRSRRERNPTPRRRWGSTPDRCDTTVPTSAGAHRVSRSARAWVLAVRERVAATAREASTTSASMTSGRDSSIRPSCLDPPTRPRENARRAQSSAGSVLGRVSTRWGQSSARSTSQSIGVHVPLFDFSAEHAVTPTTTGIRASMVKRSPGRVGGGSMRSSPRA